MTERRPNLLIRARVLAALTRMREKAEGVTGEEILWNIEAAEGQRYPITGIMPELDQLTSDGKVHASGEGTARRYRLHLEVERRSACPLAQDVATFCAPS